MIEKTIILAAAAIVSAAFPAFAAPTAKAVYDANAATFTFYYDENTYEGDGVTQYALPAENKWNTAPEWNGADIKPLITKVVFDESFADCRPVCLNDWFSGCSLLTTIEHIEYLDTSNAGYANYMFKNCKSLTSIDLSHFNTDKMLFRETFAGCSGIEVLDLTSFTKFQDLRSTFSGMSSLKTIYVSDLLDCNGSSDTADTFKGCNALVGGAGTSFKTAGIKTGDYARVDNPPDAPGYFTLGQKKVPPVIESVTAMDLTHESVTIIVKGETLNGGTVAVELIAGGATEKTEEMSAFGSMCFTGLTPETGYAVKVTATSSYGTTTVSDCVFSTPAKPADYWLYDAAEGTLSWSEWKFAATQAADGTVKVGAVTHWPEVAMALDFSLPVKDADGADCVISDLSPAFGHHDKESSYKPAGYEPQCLRVGLLTLPGEGLVSIGQAAFAACANATGVVKFPSTLASLGISAFADCYMLQIDGSTIPGGVTKIPQYCFRGLDAMFGDVVLTNAVSVEDSAFQGTAITSVAFGPALVSIGGNYERGAFQNCAALTNLVFDAASKARITSGFVFLGCSSLEELNLGGVVDFAVASDKNDYSNIASCPKLRKITFGAGLTNLMYNAMAGATALEEVVFEGLPPVGLGLPYLSAKNSKGEHVAGYDSMKITTFVHRKVVNTPNEAGKSWADYAAGGRIESQRRNPANNTTWAADFIWENVDPANRPLLAIEPMTGTVMSVR